MKATHIRWDITDNKDNACSVIVSLREYAGTAIWLLGRRSLQGRSTSSYSWFICREHHTQKNCNLYPHRNSVLRGDAEILSWVEFYLEFTIINVFMKEISVYFNRGDHPPDEQVQHKLRVISNHWNGNFRLPPISEQSMQSPGSGDGFSVEFPLNSR